MTRRRPAEGPPPVHSDAFHAAITRELVRLSLGGRGDPRPELLHRVVATAARAAGDLQQRYLQRIREMGSRADRGRTT